MSDSSDSDRNTSVYKLRSRKNFPSWKQKTLSMASSKGYERFLLEDVKVEKEEVIDDKETEYIEEADADERRKLKAEWQKMVKVKKKSLDAAAMLTCSVRNKDLKMLAKCKKNPKKMFDMICEKYGNREDSDLTELLEDFATCKLKSKWEDPMDWFVELDAINEQLQEIDDDFAKSEKEICAHILSSLPRGYSGVKTVIQMTDNYLDSLENVKLAIAKHWKVNHRNKSKNKNKKKSSKGKESSSDEESESSSDEGSSSDSSTSTKKKRRTKDKHALVVTKGVEDTINDEGKIICGHCGRIGHSHKKCWILHGVPEHIKASNGRDKGK